jgi:hypothetical protein
MHSFDPRDLARLAAVAHEHGVFDLADRAYAAALEALRGDPSFGPCAAAFAALCADRDDIDEAERLFGEVVESTAALRMHRLHLDLARARRSRSSIAHVRRELADALVTDDEHLEVATRLLMAAVARGDAREVSPPIAVGGDVAWFRVGQGPRVDVRRHRATRLVLRALVEQRLTQPGVPLRIDEIVAFGWPGESMRASSATARVYVAVLALRKLGLRPVLLAQDGGYMIDPSAPCRRAIS